jgi:hypothetical protein
MSWSMPRWGMSSVSAQAARPSSPTAAQIATIDLDIFASTEDETNLERRAQFAKLSRAHTSSRDIRWRAPWRGTMGGGNRMHFLRSFIDDPRFAASLLPLAVAFLSAGLIRLAGGAGRGATFADAGIGLGILAVFLALYRAIPFLFHVSNHAVGEAALAGLGLGAVLTLGHAGSLLRRTAAVVMALAILYRLGGLAMMHGARVDSLVVALAALGGMLALLRLEAAGGRGANPLVLLLVASVGLAGVAYVGASVSLAQLAGGIAAAAGGFLLWNWPVPRWRFGAMGVLAGGGAFVAVAASLALLLTEPPYLSLALLLLVFLAEPVAARLPFGRPGGGLIARAAAPIALGLVAAVPTLAAIGLAVLESRTH